MADVRLITILPVAQVSGATAAPDTGGGQAPIAISAPVGSLLSGFIINRDASGNPILRTANADIVFSSQFFLKIGSEVVLRVENRGGQNQARILSVNGQPPDVAETISAFAGDPEVIVGQSAQPSTRSSTGSAAAADEIIARPPSANVLTGTLLPERSGRIAPAPVTITLVLQSLSAPPSPATSSAAAVNPPAFTSLTAPAPRSSSAIQETTFTPAAGAPSPLPPAPPSASANPYAAYARGVYSAAPYSSFTAPTASPAEAPDTAATPSSSLPANRPLPETGQRITATVSRLEGSGDTVLQTSFGVIRLTASQSLPIGAQAVLEVRALERTPQMGALSWADEPLPDAADLASDWPTLKQIISLLMQSREAGMGESSLPLLLRASTQPLSANSPVQIAAGILFFASALRGGDFRSWLGKDNTSWLMRAGHQALLDRADAEFAVLARPYQEAPVSSWQVLAFPFMAAGELQQVRLFTKRDRKQPKDGKNREHGDTRFIVEVELSQLGEMQLDGFVRHGGEALEFDLLVRSLKPLDALIQKDIFMIYQRMAEVTGYRGSLQFQAVKAFALRPLEEMNAEHLRDVIV